MGPIQLFLLGFEDFTATGALAEELISLSESGTIRIIDARIMMKDAEGAVVAARFSELDDAERADLRAAAGALIGVGAGAVLGGQEGAAAGLVLGAEAAMDMGDLGLTGAQLDEAAAGLKTGQAVLLLVIENTWAAGLSLALRGAGVTEGTQHYLTPEALVALGAMLGAKVKIEG
ncbi:MAG: hypothetical protein ACR2QK_12315 [Acidimicrobiales bacterium]